jgi:hypothetical protein
VPVGGSIPCWKQRTKGQWLAWIARRLRWVLDAFYVTLFLTLSPDRRRCLTFWSREWGRLPYCPNGNGSLAYGGNGMSSLASMRTNAGLV